MAERIYFYPHAYLRDRQLDTVRNWPVAGVVNPEIANARRGDQVVRTAAVDPAGPGWQTRLPLINLKCRPRDAPTDAVVYVWNSMMLSGPFIADIDNQFAFTAYNVRATRLYRPILTCLLASHRCREIRCMSQACLDGLTRELGHAAAKKARVRYPRVPFLRDEAKPADRATCRFLFVATQFEIKGGCALLRAFRQVRAAVPTATLDLVTHLPNRFEAEARDIDGVHVHAADFGRDEIASRFLAHSDVLVHPTYADSFAMVVLEALGHGLPVIATDVYAIAEMVSDGVNGALLDAPVAIWNGIEPVTCFPDLARLLQQIRVTDTATFETRLAEVMLAFARDPERRRQAGEASLARARVMQQGR